MNPNRLILIVMACLICLAPSTALASPPREANPDFAAIDTYIAARMKDLHIPGLALGIVRGDQTVYLKGFASPTHQGDL